MACILAKFLRITSTFYLLWLLYCVNVIDAQLNPYFYVRTCPKVEATVRATMKKAVALEPRIAASILRLHFHDCFVNGCDGSVLLDDTPNFRGEKSANPNQNSLKGFKVIDEIKWNVESICKARVSCSDILALAARDAVVLSGGPTWKVPLGRRDARTASYEAAIINLPAATSNITGLISSFAAKNLNARDMTALSGAHTIGMARCGQFRERIYQEPPPNNINPLFAKYMRAKCLESESGDNIWAPLDVGSRVRFDNHFYKNIIAKQGLLNSDQELLNNGPQVPWVRLYAKSNVAFGNDFVNAMIKMSTLSPLTGTNGEIRRHCRFVN